MFDYSDLIGIPFKYGGRDYKKRELDCYGLAIEVYKRLGKILPEYQSEEDFKLINNKIDIVRPLFKKIDKPVSYCLVLLKIHPKFISHIGIMLDKIKFIHTMHKRFVTIERSDDIAWQKRIEGFYIYVG